MEKTSHLRPLANDGPSAEKPLAFLMVCLGNICRSPLAEGILHEKARAAGLHWTIESAGTNGSHIGEAPHRLSQKVALHNGIDISVLNEVHPGQDEDVPDPWYGPEPGYHEVYKMIDTAADHIIANYRAAGSSSAKGQISANEQK